MSLKRDFLINLIKSNKKVEKTKLEYYEIVKLIGKGSYGKVYLGYQILTGVKVAIKCYDKVTLRT